MATGLFRAIQRTLVQGVSSWARPSLMGVGSGNSNMLNSRWLLALEWRISPGRAGW